ncbi:MAG TPA: gluconokinase [Euzebyales bacterium]|nr:gluconokinase [Euzebyales bacterium]
MAGDVVVGVDVGTTATKVVSFSADGVAIADASRGYPLHSPQPGWAEQNPDVIAEAALDAAAQVVAGTPGPIAAIGLSSVMHSLIGLGADGAPLTPVITFADSRAWPQALRLRHELGVSLYRATGTPIHPMAPLAKLLWFAEERPDVARQVRWWVSVKEYLLRRLCGSDVVDHGVASATGLFDLVACDWHAGALRAARVDPGQLGRPVPTTTVVDGLRPDMADRLGVERDTAVVVGASDGVLANLGVGAMRPDVAALSIGTSGAIRVTVDQPRTDPKMRTFCYTLSDRHWVLGGAISNGGLVLRWLADELLGGDDYDQLTAAAAAVPPGSDGILMLPYLTGERAPRWSPLRGGVLFGLRVEHQRGHLVRAGLEGVALQLRLVADALREAGAGAEHLRVTGGFVESELWLQIVADVLNSELEVPRVEEAVAYGAALLAFHALGQVDDLDAAAEGIEITRTIRPDPASAARYDEVAARYAELLDRLEPMLRG